MADALRRDRWLGAADLVGAVKDFLVGILPPEPGDQNGTTRWHWAVWMKLWLLIVFAFWSLDLVPGFPGLARAEDVKQLSADIRETRGELLSSNIFELRVKQCSPDTTTALRQAYGEQLGRLLRSYRELTGTSYELPACEDVR